MADLLKVIKSQNKKLANLIFVKANLKTYFLKVNMSVYRERKKA